MNDIDSKTALLKIFVSCFVVVRVNDLLEYFTTIYACQPKSISVIYRQWHSSSGYQEIKDLHNFLPHIMLGGGECNFLQGTHIYVMSWIDYNIIQWHAPLKAPLCKITGHLSKWHRIAIYLGNGLKEESLSGKIIRFGIGQYLLRHKTKLWYQ